VAKQVYSKFFFNFQPSTPTLNPRISHFNNFDRSTIGYLSNGWASCFVASTVNIAGVVDLSAITARVSSDGRFEWQDSQDQGSVMPCRQGYPPNHRHRNYHRHQHRHGGPPRHGGGPMCSGHHSHGRMMGGGCRFRHRQRYLSRVGGTSTSSWRFIPLLDTNFINHCRHRGRFNAAKITRFMAVFAARDVSWSLHFEVPFTEIEFGIPEWDAPDPLRCRKAVVCKIADYVFTLARIYFLHLGYDCDLMGFSRIDELF